MGTTQTKTADNDKKEVKNVRPAIKTVDRHPSSIEFDRPIECVLFKTRSSKYWRLTLKLNSGTKTVETTLILQKGQAKDGSSYLFGSSVKDTTEEIKARTDAFVNKRIKGSK